MRKVEIDDVDSYMGPSTVRRPVARALETTQLGMNYFELEEGESFAFGYHAHENQEEVFHVLSGAVTFETEDGELTVEAGEIARAGPGEYQRGVNRDTERVRALAIGAPKDTGETEILRECEDCGERTPQTIEMTDDRDALVTLCEDCGAETGRFT